MSVHDREPKMPKDDTGKGLRFIGWMFLIWTVFSLVWVPSRVLRGQIAMVAIGACFIIGIVLVAVGYVVQWLAPSDVELAETTHRLMEETHSGNQLEDPLFATGNGPGIDPKRVA